MKTLVIGTGGREHALAIALSRDPAVTELHAAPGNPGIGALATLHPAPLATRLVNVSSRSSFNVTLLAVDGPSLRTWIVKVTCSPATTGRGDASCVTTTSACGVTPASAVAALLVAVGSDVSLVAVAVFRSVSVKSAARSAVTITVLVSPGSRVPIAQRTRLSVTSQSPPVAVA